MDEIVAAPVNNRSDILRPGMSNDSEGSCDSDSYSSDEWWSDPEVVASANGALRHKTKSRGHHKHRVDRDPITFRDHRGMTSKDRALHQRYKYLQKLASLHADSREEFLMPAHVIPPFFFMITPIKPGQKQSSIVTIFAVGNLMIGSSLLSIPWAIQQAGLALGICLILAMCALSLYTCLLVVNLTLSYERRYNAGKPADFSDVCNKYIGPIGKWTAVSCSIVAFVGAMLAYWILMSNFLFNDVSFLFTAFTQNASVGEHKRAHNLDYRECICPINSSFYQPCYRPNKSMPEPPPDIPYPNTAHFPLFNDLWSATNTVPFFLIILILPIINFKSPTFFAKFNSLGTVSVIYIISFLILKAVSWNVNLAEPGVPGNHIEYFSPTFPALTGILMLAFFTHNGVVPVLRNNKVPENNTRDVCLGYVVGLLAYLIAGLVFYLSYPLDKGCIQADLLDNFLSSDIFTFIARIFLFFQMVCVYPLLAYILRIQVFHAFFNNHHPKYWQIFCLNIAAVVFCAVVAKFVPNIGTVTRYTGAFCGAAYVTFLPCLSYMKREYWEANLSYTSMAAHGLIIAIGALNFLAQFFIEFF